MSNQNRHPEGTSVGGQWAPGSAGEVDMELDFEDAFDGQGYAPHEPVQPISEDGRYGLALDDWEVREDMVGVRTEHEVIGLAGFVDPEKTQTIQALSYDPENVDREVVERIRRQVAPASTNAELLHAAHEHNRLTGELREQGYSDDPINVDAPIDELILRDQARRGMRVTAAPKIAGVESFGPGGGYAERWDGGRYEPGMDTKEVAKEIRGEVKQAVKGGWLPEDFKYSVVTDRFAGGSAIGFSATAKELRDDQLNRRDPDYGYSRQRPETAEVQRRMSALADSYRSVRTDTMTDLFNVSFYCTPQVRGQY